MVLLCWLIAFRDCCGSLCGAVLVMIMHDHDDDCKQSWLKGFTSVLCSVYMQYALYNFMNLDKEIGSH